MSDVPARYAPALAFAALMLVYVALMPSGLRGADSAEFATLMAAPGVAHPPGYPLYTIYLRALAWLPFSEFSQAAAFATMLLGAASGALIAATGRALGLTLYSAVLLAFVVGTSFTVLPLHTHPEVFALNNLIASAIIFVSVRPFERSTLQLAVLAGLAGLGLSNHHSIVLLAPLGLWAAWGAFRSAETKGAALLTAAAALAVGLLPYAYLYFTWAPCDDCLSWGAGGSLSDLWGHVTRADYGTTSLGVAGERDVLGHLGAFGAALFTGGFGLLPLAMLGGVARGWKSHRALVLAVTACVVLTGPVFVAMFNVGLSAIGEAIVSRFYALPVIASVPLIAMLLRDLNRRWLAVFAVWALAGTAQSVAAVASSDGTTIDDYVLDSLEPLPANAIVLSTGDHRYFGSAYMQLARGVRTDVVWLDAKLLAYDWYVDRLDRRLGTDLPRTSDNLIPIKPATAALIATGRPVFVTHVFAEAVASFPSYPIRTVIRLLPPGERPPAPRDLAAQNAAFLDTMRFDPTQPIHDPWAMDLVHQYVQPWRALEPVLRSTGDPTGADRAKEISTILGQQLPNPL